MPRHLMLSVIRMAPAQMRPNTRVNTWLADCPGVLWVLMLSTRDIITQINSGPHRSQLRNSLQWSSRIDGNNTYRSFIPTIFRSLSYWYLLLLLFLFYYLLECQSQVLLECLFGLDFHLWTSFHFLPLPVTYCINQHILNFQVHLQILYVLHLNFRSF